MLGWTVGTYYICNILFMLGFENDTIVPLSPVTAAVLKTHFTWMLSPPRDPRFEST